MRRVNRFLQRGFCDGKKNWMKQRKSGTNKMYSSIYTVELKLRTQQGVLADAASRNVAQETCSFHVPYVTQGLLNLPTLYA